ncbi:peptidylprolyl isomerase [Tumidithrix elongata RA019]|uniref:peptidylprolyl isomerase n=1 Tax=Tumidithrix elongata BACA0141 TaxID=2716417 RepID=A0AAW9Q2R0_9CYAN|nr:peptidylprolyl isomerase [Tumidithrix elongata RA019]
MVRNKFLANWSLTAVAIAMTFLIAIGCVVYPQPSFAALPNKSAIKDARVLLRNALPVDNLIVREIQLKLEGMPRQANLKRWKGLSKDIDSILSNVSQKREQILASVIPTAKQSAEENLTSLNNVVISLQEAIATKDRNNIKPLSEKALEYVGTVESQMVQAFPFEVPAKYAGLPQLKGRAIVEMETEKGSFTMTLDGFSAPVNAGQFVDLVQRGFYNGLTFNRADDNFFLQAGDPAGEADGFVDPATGKVRTVPLEIRVVNKKDPVYEHTFDELGLVGTLPVLPFSAYGTVAMAHPGSDPNGGSSQFFLYLFESDLTPAGLNLIDGNYTAFGYVTTGEEVLRKLKLGDKILSARVISGLENLVTSK